MRLRRLTSAQIERARRLRAKYGYTKVKLARMFHVGQTTIWEHVFRKQYIPRICIPCARCEICLTKEIKTRYIPANYQMGNLCIGCYLKQNGLEFRLVFRDLIELD